MLHAQLIEGPVIEPVTLSDVKLQLGFGPMQDSDRAASQILNDKLRGFIVAARQKCEDWCNRVFVTQRWLLRMEGFPGKDWRYNWNGYPAILLPKPPFQSVEFVRYVDTAGDVQDLPLDTSYGNASLQYGYQLFRGTETAPAVLYSSWARPWPPTRMVPSNVMVQFRCGYGRPVTASMTQGSNLLSLAGMAFNADDAPKMTGDTGLPIFVPGAGNPASITISPFTNLPVAGALSTNIASVDPATGQATLDAPAAATVSNVPGWAGQPVPAVITTAIKMLVEWYYENGGSKDEALPRVVNDLLDPYRNLVS